MDYFKNKKGQFGIILFFLILFTILIAAFAGAMIISVIDYASDTVTPIMKELGVVGDSNISEYSTYTFGTVNTIVQAFPWLLALCYGIALVFSIVFVVGYSYNPHPVFIGLYIAMMILLIFGSIIMSNMYQDIYSGTDEIATRLQEQPMTSYMILYSPFILTLIAVVAGILLFARTQADAGGFEP